MKPVEPAVLFDALRDARGRPVPYVNLWSGEADPDKDADTWTIERCPYVDGPAVHWPECRGEGKPDFTRQHMVRQRRCMDLVLCQVCGRKVDKPVLILLHGIENTQRGKLRGEPALVVAEPWLHEECARYALAVCPGLLRRIRTGRLMLVRPLKVKMICSRGWFEGPNEAESRRINPAMWIKIMLFGWRELEVRRG